MEEKRNTAGRPRIYDEESSGYGRELEYRRRMRAEAQRKAAEKPAEEEQAAAKPAEAAGKGQRIPRGDSEYKKPLRDKLEKGTDSIRRSAGSATGSNRQREQENALKMQVLIVILGILTALLAVAILYEIVLGNGTKETGKERMAVQESYTQIMETYPEDEADTENDPEDTGAASGSDLDGKDPVNIGTDGNG